jgi:hypothetical integral membrane protein (TIGR02206 family)
VGPYFAYTYGGPAFVQLGVAHIGALLLIMSLALASWKLPLKKEQRRVVRWTLAALLVINELGWHAWHIFYGIWTVQALLPLNLCNLMVFASAWTLVTKNQTGYEFVYLLGIPAASQVLITPALGPYGYPHVLFFQIFISHGGIVLAALYLTLGEEMRPRSWQSVRRVAGWTMLYALAVFWLNQVLGSNYLFLAYKPPAATLVDYLGPWPWYILGMVAIGFGLVTALYWPFHIQDMHSESHNARAKGSIG